MCPPSKGRGQSTWDRCRGFGRRGGGSGRHSIVSISNCYLELLSLIFKAKLKITQRLYANLVHLDSQNKHLFIIVFLILKMGERIARLLKSKNRCSFN